MQHFKSINDMHRSLGYPLPEIPMLSLLVCNKVPASGVISFTADFYMIAFKKMKSGTISYGRTKYDHESGSLFFTKPGQRIEMQDITLEEEAFIIWFHDDYLMGHGLHKGIKKYGFFNYELNEALHVSPREEQIVWELYRKIETEYNNNPDEFSKEIILGHVQSILQYSQRFYKRQFINRKILSGTTISKFNDALSAYFETGSLLEKGLPTVSFFADRLQVSPRYLSDMLKQETGKTAMELLHLFLITEAKNMLIAGGQNISEIAYALGFENPTYFSRLFKKETGISPNQFKKHHLN